MSRGRPNYGLWMPTEDFQDHIEEYRFNKFLYIGIRAQIICEFYNNTIQETIHSFSGCSKKSWMT